MSLPSESMYFLQVYAPCSNCPKTWQKLITTEEEFSLHGNETMVNTIWEEYGMQRDNLDIGDTYLNFQKVSGY